MQAVFDATKAWIRQPFTSQMDLVHWFLIVGLILVSVGIWTRILSHFRE